MLVVFAGGATGGHIYPGVAVARALAEIDGRFECEFWGSGRALEAEILKKENLPSVVLPSAPLPHDPLAIPRFVWSIGAGYFGARRLLKSKRASAVVGLGGFSSFAPVVAASRMGLPAFLLEQNAVPGVANIRLARRATLSCLSWQASAEHLPSGARWEVTGNPLRRFIVEAAAGEYNPSGGILVLGGSTGAVGVNSMVVDAVKDLAALGRRITHQAGGGDFERVRAAYAAAGVAAEVVPYIDDMPSAYSGAALAIARAGGTTLSELAIFGVPSILVPYPHHKDCHQMANARIFTGAAAARIIEEGKGAGAALAAAAKEMLADSAALRKMHVAAKTLGRPEAARTVASRINESLQGRRAVANS